MIDLPELALEDIFDEWSTTYYEEGEEHGICIF
jgi:hypothetical protein